LSKNGRSRSSSFLEEEDEMFGYRMEEEEEFLKPK